jgi:argininosuccinate lyase
LIININLTIRDVKFYSYFHGKTLSGRFKEKDGKGGENFTSSLSFDIRLWKYDIEGSVARKNARQAENYSKKDVELISGLEGIKRRDTGRQVQVP